ncbi:MAG: tRNA 2-thiouridine(34) synthase MnmA [Syntrophorhabdaceae bacterium]|nr:tRNA 2-thiouridine(34) synthase MnmA [Syntrophorhabdaceae bacterium]
MKKDRILAAMSGGVDSSVVALLLARDGWDVIGISMDLHEAPEVPREGDAACYSLGDLYDARRVCDLLKIPYYVLNMRDEFRREVIDPFMKEYRAGRTPNPCVLCNEHLKFRALLRKADELGAVGVATGHYAVIKKETDGRHRLFAAPDSSKDQSYFLYSLDSDRLRRIMFPVGGMSKDETRKIASDAGLPVHEKKESQDICFVSDESYATFMKRNGIKEEKGRFTDREGNFLGEHKGIVNYTVGQRKGLGVSSREPLYVVSIDAEKNEVVLGPQTGTFSDGAVVTCPSFVAGAPPSGEFRATARIRYRHPGAPCTVRVAGDRLDVRFDTPQKSVTPGQALVLYSEDEVLGGGRIECAGALPS